MMVEGDENYGTGSYSLKICVSRPYYQYMAQVLSIFEFSEHRTVRSGLTEMNLFGKSRLERHNLDQFMATSIFLSLAINATSRQN